VSGAEDPLVERLKADARLFHEGADQALGATERELALQGLPWADLTDLANGDIPRTALATAEAWQEWLAQESGGWALVDGKLMRETNFMARASIGDTAGPYVKTSEAPYGAFPVWDRQ
jgi:hypothetical protein